MLDFECPHIEAGMTELASVHQCNLKHMELSTISHITAVGQSGAGIEHNRANLYLPEARTFPSLQKLSE